MVNLLVGREEMIMAKVNGISRLESKLFDKDLAKRAIRRFHHGRKFPKTDAVIAHVLSG
jgi:hypothetical protein